MNIDQEVIYQKFLISYTYASCLIDFHRKIHDTHSISVQQATYFQPESIQKWLFKGHNYTALVTSQEEERKPEGTKTVGLGTLSS